MICYVILDASDTFGSSIIIFKSAGCKVAACSTVCLFKMCEVTLDANVLKEPTFDNPFVVARGVNDF